MSEELKMSELKISAERDLLAYRDAVNARLTFVNDIFTNARNNNYAIEYCFVVYRDKLSILKVEIDDALNALNY